MFVFSVRGKTLLKAICLCVLSGVALMLIGGGISAARAARTVGRSIYRGVDSNDERREFLARFGWETSEQPVEIVLVQVPAEFDEVYLQYAELQKEQGFVLEKFKGKSLTRYTYAVTNYEGQPEGSVRANMLMSGSTVVGGDICSLLYDGFIHGFEKPSGESGAAG